jgi:cobalt-zinc-cadmium efflux system membrane fusion protein
LKEIGLYWKKLLEQNFQRRVNKMKGAVVLIFMYLISIIALDGCSNGKGKTISKSTEVVGDTVFLRSDIARGIKVVKPVLKNNIEETRLLGKVDFDPDYTTQVYSLVNGSISRIYVTQGSLVQKGDVLAEIHSSDYASAISDYEKALSNLNIAEKNLSRVKDLYSNKILSDREMQMAENDYQYAKADYERAYKTISILGWEKDHKDTDYRIRAPISGTVLYRGAEPGSEVRADGSPLFVIGNTRRVWIDLNVFQNEMSRLSIGDSVLIYFPGTGFQALRTRINYISNVMDQNTFTAVARCVANNPLGILKPNMYCIATVVHREGKALFVPPSSVIYDSDGNTYVFVRHGERSFEKRKITISKMSKGGDIVVIGLNQNDEIVLEKALFLNEEFSLAIK